MVEEVTTTVANLNYLNYIANHMVEKELKKKLKLNQNKDE